MLAPPFHKGRPDLSHCFRRYVPHAVSYQGSVRPASSLERLLERLTRTVVGWARAADGCRKTCTADHMATRTTTSSFSKAACIAKYARTATRCLRLGWASTGRASFPKGHFASCSISCSRRRSTSRQMPRVARPGLCVRIGVIASRVTSLSALRAEPTGAVAGKIPANTPNTACRLFIAIRKYCKVRATQVHRWLGGLLALWRAASCRRLLGREPQLLESVGLCSHS